MSEGWRSEPPDSLGVWVWRGSRGDDWLRFALKPRGAFFLSSPPGTSCVGMIPHQVGGHWYPLPINGQWLKVPE